MHTSDKPGSCTKQPDLFPPRQSLSREKSYSLCPDPSASLQAVGDKQSNNMKKGKGLLVDLSVKRVLKVFAR